ncbi:hypothetical protein L218DRAFT_240389 [Marasmius fiardii PR-910]|nr:hypothetical protein L218DRAFT_240389 [Marasmius fiardii PR-910]
MIPFIFSPHFHLHKKNFGHSLIRDYSSLSSAAMTAFPLSLYITSESQDLDIPVKQMEETMGAVFIGVVFATFLYGMSFVQAYVYFFVTPSRDKWPLKTLVATVLLCDTIHQILISHTLYTYVILNYGKPLTLGMTVWSLLAEVLFNGFIGLLVQCFLMIRVWRLSKKNVWLVAPAFLLVFAEFGCILAFGIKALVSVKTFADLATMKALSITVNALAAAGDVYITGSLSYLLRTSRTGFQSSDAMIGKLITYTVNTGLLTTLCAIASLISILAAPTTFIYITFFFAIGRLYANSLLATLNARQLIREVGAGWNSTDSNNVINFQTTVGSTRRCNSRNGVTVHIEYDTDFDGIEKTRSVDAMEMSPVSKSDTVVHGSLEEVNGSRNSIGIPRSFCDIDDDDDDVEAQRRSSIVRPAKCITRSSSTPM